MVTSAMLLLMSSGGETSTGALAIQLTVRQY
jgi:hypothetical protein